MQMSAGCELVLEAAEETPLVTMLRPRRGQRLLDDRFVLSSPLPFTQYFDAFGNLCQRLTMPRGELRVRAISRAEVEPQIVVNRHVQRTPVARLPDSALQFTLPSRYCPSDKMLALGKQIAPRHLSGYDQVQAIRDHVYEKLEYRYGVSNGSTDALETLEHGAGVCRDFSHVAIALCRAIDIPARMAVGYLHDLAPMDLHAWFEAYIGDRWYTFDATEDTLAGGRIVVAYGRDAADVAFLTDFGSLQLRTMKVWTERIADESNDEAPSRESLAAAG